MRKTVKPYSTYVRCAIQIIKQHIELDPFRFKTSAELLDHLNTPHRNLVEKAFKEMYGYRIKEYQVKQRLQQAKKFLEEGQPKKKVATKCYYSTPSSFSTAFKKEFKMSPTAWEHSRAKVVTVSRTAKKKRIAAKKKRITAKR